MRFWTKPGRKKFNKYEWNRFYPWLPRRIILGEKLTPEDYLPPHHWVCFEWIERIRITPHYDSWGYYKYRHCGTDDEKSDGK